MCTAFRQGAVVAVIALAAVAQADPPPNLVPWGASPMMVLTLRPVVTTQHSVVMIGDIANLEGGFHNDRQRAAALDLADLADAELAISREQVRYRLQLGGFDPASFRVDGPVMIRVRPSATSSITQVAAVETPPKKLDSSIDAQHLAVPGPVGVTSKAGSPTSTPEFLIRRNDTVELVCNVGNMKVSARGQALEDGRLGQMIRLRNIDSFREVHGRVVEHSVVEVDLARRSP